MGSITVRRSFVRLGEADPVRDVDSNREITDWSPFDSQIESGADRGRLDGIRSWSGVPWAQKNRVELGPYPWRDVPRRNRLQLDTRTDGGKFDRTEVTVGAVVTPLTVL